MFGCAAIAHTPSDLREGRSGDAVDRVARCEVRLNLLVGPGSLKWNAGILFGLTSASPRETIRWQLEYEIHF